jgi:farnesyl-diphosphate farnesyltransferase
MHASSPPLLTDLLKQVSRSFYLTLRVLPGAIRPQIGLAYLMARASDTIADTEVVPVSMRLNALEALRERFQGKSTAPLNLAEFAFCAKSSRAEVSSNNPVTLSAGDAHSSSDAERALLERIEEALSLVNQFSQDDQQRIRQVLETITSGQSLDLSRFAGATQRHIVALQSDEELDDYTYRVAGCVGEFWTRICRAHLFPKAAVDEAALLGNGNRFGKGLQLTNILRDLPSDLAQGRCYIPAGRLREIKLPPEALLHPATMPAFRPLYQGYLAQAEAHLAAGWTYTNTLPRGCARVRLACAWPILIGMRTLRRLRETNVLDASRRIKISRQEVRKLLLLSLVCYPWPRAWDGLFERAGRA